MMITEDRVTGRGTSNQKWPECFWWKQKRIATVMSNEKAHKVNFEPSSVHHYQTQCWFRLHNNNWFTKRKKVKWIKWKKKNVNEKKRSPGFKEQHQSSTSAVTSATAIINPATTIPQTMQQLKSSQRRYMCIYLFLIVNIISSQLISCLN